VALKTGLEGKPWYFGLAAGLGVGLVVFLIGWWRLVIPVNDDYDSAVAQLASLQSKIQEGRSAKNELQKFREEVRQLELELDKLLRILPARRNTPDLMRRIRSLAEQEDFTLRAFTPGVLSDKEFYSEWPIKVDLDGSYHNLALFFDRVSRFSRIINVENLEIRALPQVKSPKGQAVANPHTINAKFTAKTFVYKEPEPEDTTAKDKTKKGKAPAIARPTPPPGSPGSEDGGPTVRSRPPGGPD
jgi:Tfp pilus assembly protein PilO